MPVGIFLVFLTPTLFQNILTKKKKYFLILPSSLFRYSQEPKTERIFKCFDYLWSDPIYPLGALGRSLRLILDKLTKWHFHSNSKEVILTKMFSNFMVQKVQVRQIFRKGWDGRTPCQCGPQTVIVAFEKNSFVLGSYECLERLEGKIRKCLFFYDKIF